MTDDRTRDLRAMAHPLRLRMLSLLTGASLTAAEVARELGITHANASYHLRVLLDAEKIDVAGHETIRGGRAIRYRHPWRQVADGGRATQRPEDRQAWVRVLAGELVRRAAEWDTSTGTDEQPRHPGSFTDAELWVSEEDLSAARSLLTDASARLHDAAQPPRTPGTVRVSMSAALFVMSEVAMSEPATPPRTPR